MTYSYGAQRREWCASAQVAHWPTAGKNRWSISCVGHTFTAGQRAVGGGLHLGIRGDCADERGPEAHCLFENISLLLPRLFICGVGCS